VGAGTGVEPVQGWSDRFHWELATPGFAEAKGRTYWFKPGEGRRKESKEMGNAKNNLYTYQKTALDRIGERGEREENP